MHVGRDGGRRRFLGLVAGTVLAASSGACQPGRDSGRARAVPTENARLLPSVPEALWVADGSGTLRAYDGRTNKVTARVETGVAGSPTPMLALGGGLIWVYADDGRIAIVDPDGAQVKGRASVSQTTLPGQTRLVAAFGALWVVQPGGLWRVTSSGRVSEIGLPDGFGPAAAGASGDWLWLVDRGSRRLARVGATGSDASPVGQAPAPGTRLLTTGHAGLFAVSGSRPRMWLLDPNTGETESTARMPGGELILDLLAAGADMWAIGNGGTVAKITGGRDLTVSHSVRISDTSQAFPSAVGLGSLWVCDEVRSELTRVDLATGRIRARMAVPAAAPDDPAFGVVSGQRSVWLIDTDLADGVMRVDPAANRVARLTKSSGVWSGVSAVAATPPRASD